MQKDAEQRVREMQSRARLLGNGEPNFPPPQNNFPQKQKTNSAFAENPLGAVLKNTDSDTLIILALLWLLWNEHADPKLMLALLYLLL